MTKPLDVLIAAAHKDELSGLRATLGRTLRRVVERRRVAAVAVGVGMPAAAVGTCRALAEHHPKALILLGSCGLYAATTASRAPLLAPAIPEKIKLLDAAVLAKEVEFPAPDTMPIEAGVHRGLRVGLERAADQPLLGTVATTAGITVSDALAKRIQRDGGCEFENLEAFSVATACHAYDVKFAAVLVITNVVGREGRLQWAKHREAAAVSGAQVVLDWLSAGAPGL